MTARRTSFLIAASMSVSLHAAMFLASRRYELGGVAIDWPSRRPVPVEESTIVVGTELVPEPKREPESDAAPETSAEIKVGPDTEPQDESETSAEIEAEPEPQPEVEPEPEPLMEEDEPREFAMGA